MSLLDAQRLLVKQISKPEHDNFQLYKHNLSGARVAAMLETYPICQKLLGEHDFINLCEAFVSATEQSSHDLNLYGAGFSEFILDTYEQEDRLLLIDLAKLEYLCHKSYWAAKRKPFDTPRFSVLAPELQNAQRIHLASDVSVMSSKFNLEGIMAGHRSGADIGTLACCRESGSEARFYIIERLGRVAQVESIPAPEHQFLTLITQPISLSELCEQNNVDIGPLGEQVLNGRVEWVGGND